MEPNATPVVSEPQAGREGFVVLNHNLEDLDRDNRFHSSYSELTLKFGYTFRF